MTSSSEAVRRQLPQSYSSEGPNPIGGLSQPARGFPEINGALRVKPELGGVAEQTRQANRHIRAQGATLAKELVDGLA